MKPEDVKSAAKDLGDTASRSAAETKQASSEAAGDFADRAQSVKGKAADAAGGLYAQAKDSMNQASDALPGSMADAAAAGRRAYAGGADQLAKQVTKQPFEALLLAGAIGYLVGWATSRS